MKRKSLKVFALGISITLAMIFGFSNKAVNNTKIEKTTSNPEAAALVDNYKEWQAKNISNKVDQVLTLSVGWMKGLSAEHSYGVGAVSIDRTSGKISLKVKDIADGDWQLWLIENRDGENTSAMPDKADKIVEVAKFSSKDGIINFEENVDVQLFSDIRIDRVAITRAGKNPTEAFVLTGSPTLFEKMQQKRFIAQRFQKEPETSLISKFFSLFSTSSVSADDDKDDDDSDDDKDDESYLSFLISSGRDIFNNEKFNGNGRTCATCHPESNNFTIDPAFIATLPPNNPLFVAEFNPNLSQNFEKPQLMRQFGLILENVDGFNDLANKFTLRSVNHTLGLTQSLKAPDPNFLIDFTTNGRNPNPTQRTGWGGDGSPGSGSLREFAIGAVIQHFPKRLNRVSGVDFRLPNDFELDAMEAFQLSLGRQEEINIRTLTIKDSKAVAGKALFLDTGTIGEPGHKNCNACHFNAGANSAFALNPTIAGFTPVLDGLPRGFNANQATNTNGIPDVANFNLPRDGGFGTLLLPNGAFGNFGDIPGVGTVPIEEFNSPSLIEAPDTAPYFHHHLTKTLEDAIAFYGSPAFSAPGSIGGPGGPVPVSISSNPNDLQVQQIGAFLRLLNAVDNIRSTIVQGQRAKNTSGSTSKKNIVRLALADNLDAIDVLTKGAYSSNRSNEVNLAIVKLTESRDRLQEIVNQNLPSSAINQKIDVAILALRQARTALVDTNTLPPTFRN